MSDLLGQFRQWASNWFTPPLEPDPDPMPPPLPEPEPSPAPIPPVPTSPTTLIFRDLNSARSAEGLPALIQDPVLGRTSADWAASMASSGIMDHGDFADRIAAVYPNTAASEIVAQGQPDATSVVAAWMSDPPHRANILGDYDRVGVGMARDDQGSIYWCADFVSRI